MFRCSHNIFRELIIRACIKLHFVNPSNAQLNPIWNLLALLGAHPILHVSRIRAKIVNYGTS